MLYANSEAAPHLTPDQWLSAWWSEIFWGADGEADAASDYALDAMARSTGSTTLRISGDPEKVPLVSAWLREQAHQAWLMDHEDGYA